jgi:hypothetical protein
MSIVQKLTENIVERDLKKEGAALLNKWEKTGLLEGLNTDIQKNSMARLLENQAKELLREASTLASGGDVEGFAAVAFPIVRRVFGGLIANDLVSVQPMSLPSGLIFFLDFTYGGDDFNSESRRNNATQNQSVYGGGKVGQAITGGVSLPGFGSTTSTGNGGFYDLANSYAHPTGTVEAVLSASSDFGGATTIGALTEAQKKVIRFDPDILAADSSKGIIVLELKAAAIPATLNREMLSSIDWHTGLAGDDVHVRRLQYLNENGDMVVVVLDGATAAVTTAANAQVTGTFAAKDTHTATVTATDAVGALVADSMELEANENIPELDIKVDSIAVTAQTKKLKAKWSPELGQDLNAYHNLDAEVELTSILSEHVALEIDREILNDLIKGATAGTYYWSRAPGLFVDRVNGTELGATSASPDFTGTVSEWYETLIETINDVSAQIHRKTLRGGANFVVCSPEVANIMEFTAGFRASVTADADRGSIGAQKVGSLSQKFEVYVDPYFPRNIVLVGRKGSSFLESGYVYAPYVPLQVTPTIFGVEDFVPRKGVMTRYAKKMVRPDMYGVVVVRGLLGEEGA